MNILKKKQHYVPQFYLKSFCDESGKLTAFCPKQNEFKKIAPNNICFEKNLYETPASDCNEGLVSYINCNYIENIFGKYEGDFASLQRKILAVGTEKNKNALILHSNEKKIFFHFVANMLVRNPVSMEKMGIDSLSDDFKETEFYVETTHKLKEMGKSEVDSIILFILKSLCLTNEYSNDGLDLLIEEISKIDYYFLVAKEREFITTDHPVCFESDLFNKTENSNSLYMVLSPHVVVQFGNHSYSKFKRNRMILIPENLVDELNKSIIEKQHYYKWIIAHSQSAIEKAIKE